LYLLYRPISLFAAPGVNLYIGSFTKVARFDVAKVVDANMGRFCPYGCPVNSLEVNYASLLT
jgi:hypothetical protein